MEIDGLRMHYLDVGPRDGPVALLMHGMPTWSFNTDVMTQVDKKWYGRGT
jgi:pimeloyl-ACP methyl ester carboxylesterase